MKKFLPSLLVALFALAFQQASSQRLYTDTIKTADFYNPGFGLGGTPKVVFDDVNIPNALIAPGTNYMSITNLKFGLIAPASSPAFSVQVWATTLDPASVGRDSLPLTPPVSLGILNVLANTDPNPQNVTLSVGDSINPIFNFLNAPNNVYPGYTTIYVGLSFPDAASLAGWQLVTGPDMNVDTMYIYNKDDSTTPRYYSYFGTSGGVHPLASFNVEAFGKPLPPIAPVILTNFDVQSVNNENVLNWSTSQEIISNYYAIEHSTDGSSFETIGQVAAAGNSSTTRNYTYTDLNPSAGINYYRLKIVDLDNSVKYSDIKSVRNTAGNISFTAYPNPAFETLYLTIQSKKSDRAVLSVTNVAGQVVIKDEVNITTGNNKVPVKVNKLSAGTYIIKVQVGNQNFTQKFNKQ